MIIYLSLVLCNLGLSETNITVPSTESWRKNPPQTTQPVTPVLPEFREQKLSNGLTIIHSELRTVPLVSFALVTRGGSARDPQNHPGVTALMYGMLQEGAGTLDSLQFSDRIADLGATFSSQSDRDHGMVSIFGLYRNREAMLDLLATAALQPMFDAKAFQRLKTLKIGSLQQQRSSVMGLAFEVVPRLMYGATHPFGHPPGGTAEDVGRIELPNIVTQHQHIMVPQNSALITVGAMTLTESVALAEKIFGAWHSEKTPATAIPAVPQVPVKKLYFIDKRPSPQSFVLIGRPLPGRGHADEYALSVANSIYGGDFASRLNMNLRETKGYTYGASASVNFRQNVGALIAFANVRQDVTGPSLREFFIELKRTQAEPASATELSRAKVGLTRSLPGQFERISNIASAAASLFVHGLQLDYFTQLGAHYAAVDDHTLKTVFARYFDPEQMFALVVGDAEVVKPQLKAIQKEWRTGEIQELVLPVLTTRLGTKNQSAEALSVTR